MTKIYGDRDFAGSNVDIGTYHEVDDALRDLTDDYDRVLELYRDSVILLNGDPQNPNDQGLESKLADVYAEVYEIEITRCDKITEVKKNVETNAKYRKALEETLKARGVKEHADRAMKKLDKQISAAQTRARMWLAVLELDTKGYD
jgi:hypothetical protein